MMYILLLTYFCIVWLTNCIPFPIFDIILEISARCRTRILTDSDRKRNRKEVLANYKTRINIGHHHDRWMHGIEGSQSSSSVIHTRHERRFQYLILY
jgi:hypothetical protein